MKILFQMACVIIGVLLALLYQANEELSTSVDFVKLSEHASEVNKKEWCEILTSIEDEELGQKIYSINSDLSFCFVSVTIY